MEKSLDLQIPDDYTPSDGELNNIVYLTLKYSCGWVMRDADLAICLMMTKVGGPIIGNEGISRLCMITCEYAWDHICGEPEEADAEMFFGHLKGILKLWYYNSTPEERSDIGTVNDSMPGIIE